MVPAQKQLLAELTEALGEGNITLAKVASGTVANSTDWEVANGAMTSDTFCSHYCHGCNASVDPATTWTHPTDSQDCVDSMQKVADMTARGQLTESHAMGPFSGPLGEAARNLCA